MGTRYLSAALALLCAFVLAAPVRAADDTSTTVKVTLSGPGTAEMRMAVDRASAPKGEVTFVVTNMSKTLEHEMVVVRLKSADDKLPYDAQAQRVDEDKVDAIGEVSELKPGEGGKVTLHLKPGPYRLICNVEGHYAAGMWSAFTVE